MENCNSPALVGLDVGYGNLKAAAWCHGAHSPRHVRLPVGAAPFNNAPKNLRGEVDVGDGETVLIDGAPWVAGTDPQLLNSFSRQADRSYIQSSEYLALYYAALARLNLDRVAILVTGLPCDQYEGPESAAVRKRLGERLKGVHHIAHGRTVTVDRVFVLAQPMGTFAAVYHDRASLNDGRTVLVIDVGFYSVDWVVMQSGKVRSGSAKTSTQATSRILELACQQITTAHPGIQISVNRLEGALRSGSETLEVGRHRIPVRAVIEQASTQVTKQVMTDVLASVRDFGDTMDAVIVTGGGAGLFESAARQVFRHSEVHVPNDPVMANAEGYLWLAKLQSTQVGSKAA